MNDPLNDSANPATAAPDSSATTRSPKPRAAVNVDVDGLYLYDRIHGHAGTSGNTTDFDPATAASLAVDRQIAV